MRAFVFFGVRAHLLSVHLYNTKGARLARFKTTKVSYFVHSMPVY